MTGSKLTNNYTISNYIFAIPTLKSGLNQPVISLKKLQFLEDNAKVLTIHRFAYLICHLPDVIQSKWQKTIFLNKVVSTKSQ